MNPTYYQKLEELYSHPLFDLDTYLEELICEITPHLIWIHLDGHQIESESVQQSAFEDTDTKCPICLEDYSDETEIYKCPLHNCGHNYCEGCVEQVISYGTCGICRESTNTETETFPITKEDIESLCDDKDSETLIKMLKDFHMYNQFKQYIKAHLE